MQSAATAALTARNRNSGMSHRRPSRIARPVERGLMTGFLFTSIAALFAMSCAGDIDESIDAAGEPATLGESVAVRSFRKGSQGIDRVTARFESRLLRSMIDRHQAVVDESELCLERAGSPEIVALCEDLRATQKDEIVALSGWLSRWYGIEEYEPRTHPSDATHLLDLAAAPAETFEALFLERMTLHHLTAIAEASTCAAFAEHQELLGLCAGIHDAQRGELQRMTAWRRRPPAHRDGP
jgi:uncharacterized protein (DUF305 family)